VIQCGFFIFGVWLKGWHISVKWLRTLAQVMIRPSWISNVCVSSWALFVVISDGDGSTRTYFLFAASYIGLGVHWQRELWFLLANNNEYLLFDSNTLFWPVTPLPTICGGHGTSARLRPSGAHPRSDCLGVVCVVDMALGCVTKSSDGIDACVR